MTASLPDPAHRIDDEAALRALFPPTHAIALEKQLDRLDPHARDFVARSPFALLGTQAPDGRADVSPRGDPAGFVRVLDDRTLAIPDRPGNNRLDSLSNIVRQPQVGLLFLIPGFDETLRVNGRAHLTTDPDLLAAMAVNDRAPRVAVVVEVDEVFLHCAKAFRRSRLWDPEARQDRAAMPSLRRIIMDQVGTPPAEPEEERRMDDALEDDYRRTMY